ncbi:helix-turn-helix transcriptional regulator [Marivirga arenosa]|uniref:Helix-turn-helix transcriptional regulator n=1 Tax=Marivirga arenosa TaxID=3059076 RepID=A0AA49GL10_9BACT|nr:helix-turn-helix transcriptional regulator [Marivirga sp. ABR2-2]WKK85584.1 helix-turn-helix transcriptional regulator [Marivirga sp. ABR2-2]
MNTASEKLSTLSKPSNWKEKLNYQLENEAWLDKSADISFSVLEVLDDLGESQAWLAEQLGLSKQYVSQIVKGNENLSLSTIFKLQEVLGIRLLVK